MHLRLRHIILLFVICFFVASSPNLYGQKSKGKSQEDTKLREAEFYFTEGEKYYILEDYAKAMVLFQKALEITPKNATIHYKIAQIFAQGSELEKALGHIQEALKLKQDNKYFYALAADIYTQLGDLDHAAEMYQYMVVNLSNTDQYLFELAAIYLHQGKYNEALDAYSKIEKAYGISEEVISQMQKIHLQNNALDRALQEGQRLIDAYPDEESFVLKQVEILIANDKDAEAMKFLEVFTTAHPDATQSLLVLSELQRKGGDMNGAIGNIEAAFANPDLSVSNKIQLLAEYRMELSQEDLNKFGLKLAKTLAETHADVADAHTIYADLLLSAGNNEGAKDQYIKSLKIDDSNFSVWQNVLQLLTELNKPDSVILLSDKALELFPNQGTLYYFNGIAHLQKRKYEDAIGALEHGKRLSSANLSLVHAFNSMLGDAYNNVKEYEKSARAYDAALDYDPNNYAVLNNYSYFLALRKADLEKAERMSSKTVKDNPDNPTFLDTYAWVLYMRGKFKEAKKVIEKAIATENVSAIHYEHYGDILYQLGSIDEAVKQWQIAKGMNPKSELIDKKIADRKLYE